LGTANVACFFIYRNFFSKITPATRNTLVFNKI